jgi:glutathione synthase/RimK-type ligase-like ATP-grasp enzyme
LPETCLLFNARKLVAWNAHKSYLLELAQAGFTIPQTAVVKKGGHADIGELLRGHGLREAVIKPAVSASAFQTIMIGGHWNEDVEDHFEDMIATGDVIVQGFVESILTEGEISVVLIDGMYSHAVKKMPAAGDFRVQEHLGGTVAAAKPSKEVVGTALAALRSVTSTPPLYARVDGVISENHFVLMELELIEPSLYFGLNEGSADRFAEALVRRLESGA